VAVLAILNLRHVDSPLMHLTFGGQSPLSVGIDWTGPRYSSSWRFRYLRAPVRTLDISGIDIFCRGLKGNRHLRDRQLYHPPCMKRNKLAIRSAFTLGGLTSGFANSPDDLRDWSAKGFSLSLQVHIQHSIDGWRELEYEVARTGADNTIIFCDIENFDPLATHRRFEYCCAFADPAR